MADTDPAIINVRDAKRIIAATRFIEKFKAAGAVEGLVDNWRPRYSFPPGTLKRVRITGKEQIAANRWWYSGIAQRWNPTIDDIEDDTPNGWSTTVGGNPFGNPIRNFMERYNPAAGIMAPGVDTTGPDYPEGFSLQALSINSVVPVWSMRVFDAENVPKTVYYTFIGNMHDGTCKGDGIGQGGF